MERNRRKRGKRSKRAGFRAIRRLRKIDPIIASLGALIVVLSVAWGSFYWKESSGHPPVAYAKAHEGDNQERQEGKAAGASTLVSSSIPVAGAEADYEKAFESRSESKASDRTTDDAYLPPGDPRGSGEPQSSIDGNGSDGGESVSAPGRAAESSPATDLAAETAPAISDADDELPGEPNSEPSGSSPEESSLEEKPSPEEKYRQETEKTQASCAALMNGKMEEAEEALKLVDRGNPFEAKAWSDKWTGELSDAEASCDESFADVTERAKGESVSQGKIDEWTLTYEARKQELQADARSKLQRLLGG